jgi:hypothetical protein
MSQAPGVALFTSYLWEEAHSPSFRGADRRSASPESISPVPVAHDRQGVWVPGSALARRPGTTEASTAERCRP